MMYSRYQYTWTSRTRAGFSSLKTLVHLKLLQQFFRQSHLSLTWLSEA